VVGAESYVRHLVDASVIRCILHLLNHKREIREEFLGEKTTIPLSPAEALGVTSRSELS
jgi:hypothetical protein